MKNAMIWDVTLCSLVQVYKACEAYVVPSSGSKNKPSKQNEH
jgi:hypothetical protein